MVSSEQAVEQPPRSLFYILYHALYTMCLHDLDVDAHDQSEFGLNEFEPRAKEANLDIALTSPLICRPPTPLA